MSSPPAPLPSAPFLGRERELDVLTEQMYKEGLSQLRREIGADALASGMALRRKMSLDEAVEFAVASLD